MACLTSTERASILASIAEKEDQLTKANETYTALLQRTHDEYRFNSGEGSEWVVARKLKDLQEAIEFLERSINLLYRRLNHKGVVAINLRRKQYGRLI